MVNTYSIDDLDHGLFQISRPTVRQAIGYILAGLMFFVAFGMFVNSLFIPDVPQIEEARQFSSLPSDDSQYDFQPVQSGYDDDEYKQEAAFIIVPLTLETGNSDG